MIPPLMAADVELEARDQIEWANAISRIQPQSPLAVPIAEIRITQMEVPAITWAVTLANLHRGFLRQARVLTLQTGLFHAPDVRETTFSEFEEMSRAVYRWLLNLTATRRREHLERERRRFMREFGVRMAELRPALRLAGGEMCIALELDLLQMAAVGARLLYERGGYRGRFGLCANPGCLRFFFRPTGHMTRYCDPKVCGNRARVAKWSRSHKRRRRNREG
jgi:predicted RNA-binding Zn ribbon-like protein